MDKRVIFSVAGSGKTTHIISSLNLDKRSLIVTYTDGNYNNIKNKIFNRFKKFPENIVVMKYHDFLYNFCYKPFLYDQIKDNGLTFERPDNTGCGLSDPEFYMNENKQLYHNRIAKLIEREGTIPLLKNRLEKYFDELIVDEIQDISGRDFDLLEKIMDFNIGLLFVGDFYQHTFSTSSDGSSNKNLFKDFDKYKSRFSKHNMICDEETLNKSYRCKSSVCDFITKKLGINIHSHDNSEDNKIIYISDVNEIIRINNDDSIVKLHYSKSKKYGNNHKNWGEVKGEDNYHDVCILISDNILKKINSGDITTLGNDTINKLYVAITRSRNCVYIIKESDFKRIKDVTKV